MPINIDDLEKCDVVTTRDIVKDLTPDQLIKNPYVNNLFDALERILEDGDKYSRSIATEALKEWEDE